MAKQLDLKEYNVLKCQKWGFLNPKINPFCQFVVLQICGSTPQHSTPPTPNPILTSFANWYLSRAINCPAHKKYMNFHQQMYVDYRWTSAT